ncbi:MAG: 5-oxoprolinase subunit PxpB [Isosphaeraceae bacterium]
MKALIPLGDRAFLVPCESEDEAARWAETVRAKSWVGVLDVVASYDTVAVHADPDRIDLDGLMKRLAEIRIEGEGVPTGRLFSLPVLYDGQDLPEVARRLALSEEEVIASHQGTDYRVLAIGFQPGFPYAGDLPVVLRDLPRRDSPRLRVPAGSVGITGRQTCIYPSATPGGWHLIGRTPLRIVDVARGEFPLRVGDFLRFVPIDLDEFEARRGELLCSTSPRR